MKRLSYLLLLLLFLTLILSCDHNVYIDEKIDGKDIWCVGLKSDGNFFKTANEAIDFIISNNNSKGVTTDESRTIHLLQHVLSEDSDGIAVYGKQYVLSEKYRGEITVPENFTGSLYIDFGGFRYDFSNSIDYFFTIKGGSEIYIYNGQSIIFKESQSPITNPALIIGTRTVTIDEHLIDDRREGPAEEAPAAVLVTAEGSLVITCEPEKREETGVSGTFEIEEGGTVLIEDGTVEITDIIPRTTTDLSITGGHILNPHSIDSIISDAVQEGCEDKVQRTMVHGPLEHVEAKDPTCTEEGNIEYWHCINEGCGKYFSDEACTNTISYDDTVIAKLSHNLLHVEKVESSCVEHGVAEHWVCQTCGHFFIDSQANTEVDYSELSLDLKEHSYQSEWSTNCDYHWHECTVCHSPDSYDEHDWDDGVIIKEATSHDDGIKRFTCSVCSATWDKAIPAHDHAYGEEHVVDPTCTERGYTWHQCTLESCQQITIIPDSYVDPYHHDLKEKTEKTDATCLESGNKEYWYCSRCGSYSLNEYFTETVSWTDIYLSPLGHEYNSDVWIQGVNTHYHLCLRDGCGAHIDEEEHNQDRLCQDGANGHHWECTVCGVKTKTYSHTYNSDGMCTVCGYQRPPEVDGGGGFNVEIVVKEPSGYLDYVYPATEVTVSYHDTNLFYKANKFVWYLNGIEQSETGSSFVFTPTGPYTHTVICVFSNDYGSASVTKVISGK